MLTRLTPSPAERAILASALYAALFEYPLTLEELRQKLIDAPLSANDILRTYRDSAWLRRRLTYSEGFFFPPGRSAWLANRLRREDRSRALLDRHRRLLRAICALPFVRLVALSGSIAALNADEDADLDLFIITRGRRAWTVTLAVVLLAKLARQRRVVCANFVMTDACLAVDPDQRDLFTANQILHLRPLAGVETYRAFLAANPFVGRCYPNFRPVDSRDQSFVAGPAGRRVTRAIEWLLTWPSLAAESVCRRAYSWHLGRRRASWRSPDQVRLDSDHLKLHTCSHRAAILDRFAEATADAFAERDEDLIPVQRAVNS